MNNRNNMIMGMIFVVLGLLFLLKNMNILKFQFDIFDMGFLVSNFWAAFFLIIPSIFMHSAYFSGRRADPGILVPAGILLITGIICQASILFGLWRYLWPGFILAAAFGLFELYIFGTREKRLLIPVGILGGLSLIFFASISLRSLHLKEFMMPAGLILAGIWIIVKNISGGKEF